MAKKLDRSDLHIQVFSLLRGVRPETLTLAVATKLGDVDVTNADALGRVNSNIVNFLRHLNREDGAKGVIPVRWQSVVTAAFNAICELDPLSSVKAQQLLASLTWEAPVVKVAATPQPKKAHWVKRLRSGETVALRGALGKVEKQIGLYKLVEVAGELPEVADNEGDSDDEATVTPEVLTEAEAPVEASAVVPVETPVEVAPVALPEAELFS